MATPARHLALHGAIVLLVGLSCGAPYGRALNRGAEPSVIQAWRVAHSSLPIGATLMLSVAALLPSLSVGNVVSWAITGAYIVSMYAFCLSLPLAAIVGYRGLRPGPSIPANLVFAGNLVGAWASLAATVALIYAAFVSL